MVESIRPAMLPSADGGSSTMTAKTTIDHGALPKEQLDLIEQFVADFNAVEHFLRRALATDKHSPFLNLVSEYSRKHAGWRDADLLRRIAGVRNAIIHGKTEAYRYVAVPTPALAQDLRECRDRLISPPRVIPTFQRKVETVFVQDPLARVLKLIKLRDYSQFPAYEGERFEGLLTENGITRWLAHHVDTKLSLVELEDVSVREVLQNEEKRKTYHFVARVSRVDDVSGLFASLEELEAVLITAGGKESEPLLGIATRWDILHLT
jgi:predicted transcriptional regulator